MILANICDIEITLYSVVRLIRNTNITLNGKSICIIFICLLA